MPLINELKCPKCSSHNITPGGEALHWCDDCSTAFQKKRMTAEKIEEVVSKIALAKIVDNLEILNRTMKRIAKTLEQPLTEQDDEEGKSDR